jgi:hypothetical protein
MNISPSLKSVKRFSGGPILATASLFLDNQKIGLVTFSTLTFNEDDFQIFPFLNTGASALWSSYCQHMRDSDSSWHPGVLFKNIIAEPAAVGV